MNLLKKIQHYLSLAIMISLAFEKSFSLWIINLGKTLWFSWLKSNLSSRTANLVLLFFGTWNGCQGHSFTVVPILRCLCFKAMWWYAWARIKFVSNDLFEIGCHVMVTLMSGYWKIIFLFFPKFVKTLLFNYRNSSLSWVWYGYCGVWA